MTDTATASTQPQAEKPKKKRRINLTGAILISLCLGIVVGIICSVTIPSGSTVDNILIEGVFYVLGQWFIRLMQMIVVPLVFCSIVCGAASMSDPKLLGKVGVGTILTYASSGFTNSKDIFLLTRITCAGVLRKYGYITTICFAISATHICKLDCIIIIKVPKCIIICICLSRSKIKEIIHIRLWIYICTCVIRLSYSLIKDYRHSL